MKKKTILSLALAMTLLTQPVLAAMNIKIHVNGKELKTDVPPEVKQERTFVPLRFVSEELKYEVNWDQKDQRVDISKDKDTIRLWIDKKDLEVNGQKKTMDVAPYAKNNRTLVPIRFVAENLGADVDWNQKEKIVLITSKMTSEDPKDVYSFTQGVDLSKLSPEEQAYVLAFDKGQQQLVAQLKDFRNLSFRDFSKYSKMEVARKLSETGSQLVSTAKSLEALTPPGKFKETHDLFCKLTSALPSMIEDSKAAFLADDKNAAVNLTSKMTDFSVLTRQIVDQMSAEIKGEAFTPKKDVEDFLNTKKDRLFMDSTLGNLMKKITEN